MSGRWKIRASTKVMRPAVSFTSYHIPLFWEREKALHGHQASSFLTKRWEMESSGSYVLNWSLEA